ELGIEAPCFDLSSACSTFGMQLNMLRRMAAEQNPPFILTVQPEGITRCIDFSDRSSSVLFGDACTATVVSHQAKARVSLVTSNCGSNPAAHEKVGIPFGGHFVQDGRAVQGFAIRKMTELLQELLASMPGGGQSFHFIGHQANLGALKTVCERAGIPDAQHWHNVEEFGNTGASGAPAVLSAHWEELRPGDRLAVCVVGAGLTWANLLFAVEG
ncbi:MAG: ketoacyl-ACP synthase III, partial [Syntrophaceae bacterium]|nr:ketoacyl-ACP synthase III [Syntrophaceae bacterium]